MSTQAIIGKISNGDSLVYIYVHKDGHPETAGITLLHCYDTVKLVDKLLSLGNLSSLGNTLADCYAYNELKTVTTCKPEDAE